MAKVRTVVRTCDRCPVGRERTASETVRFTYEGEVTELDLCPADAAMFRREMQAWARLGRPGAPAAIASDLFDGRRQAEAARAASQRAQQYERDRADDLARLRAIESAKTSAPEVAELTSAAMSWRISHHAEERMALRGYTKREVLLAASDPEVVTPSTSQPGVVQHGRGEVLVTLNPTSKTILTVKHRDPDHYAMEIANQLREA